MGCDTFVIDEWHCCFIRLMLSEDLGSVNLRHEILYVCMCGMWLLMILLSMIMLI